MAILKKNIEPPIVIPPNTLYYKISLYDFSIRKVKNYKESTILDIGEYTDQQEAKAISFLIKKLLTIA